MTTGVPGSHGQIVTVAQRFWAKVDRTGDCWLWTGARVRDYGQIRVRGRARMLAHRFSWELHRGPIPDGLCVLHRCDNPTCVNPEHLFVGTQAENVADREHKRRTWSHLKPEQVLDIRESKEPMKETAARYGVGLTTVWNIKRGKSWRHLS